MHEGRKLHHIFQQHAAIHRGESGVHTGMDKNRQLTYRLGGLGVLLGGLGVFLLSGRGRDIVRSIASHLERAPEGIEQFAEATQVELDRIQQTLNQIAQRLEAIS
ncbi:MAG TPA: hypothetical protein VM912_21330 [Terriglobales bacterium]|nr:hypothetical protein [Terriglobales bacterium]